MAQKAFARGRGGRVDTPFPKPFGNAALNLQTENKEALGRKSL